MAIVIKTQPRTYSPAYNINEHCIFQDDAATRTKPDYKYLFDIEIEDYITATTIEVRTKVAPDPVHGLGVQDVQGFVEQYINEHIVPHDDTDAIRNTDNAIIRYSVKYGEEYRLTAGDPVVEYRDEEESGILWVWGASFEHHRWTDFYNLTEYPNYLFKTQPVGEFLTNYKTPSVYITDLGWHWYLADDPTEIDFMRVLTYDSSGAAIGTFDIPNNANTAVDNSRMNSVATSPQSLNNITGAFLVGAQPVITPTVATYTIECFKSPSSAVSEVLTFTIDSECFYETYRIHFENEYGAYDSFNFKGNSVRSSDGERKAYNSNANNLSGAGITYSHVTAEKINYYTKFTNKVALSSDFINQEQLDWLKEMSFTTQAYLEFVDNSGVHNFKPIIIRSATWSQKKDLIDKVFTFDIEIELADNFKQRR